MRFFRSRAFSAGNAAIFFTFASLFGAVFFFAQFLQTALGYGRSTPGLRLIPWTATFITVAPIAGALADRIGERPFMVGGLLLQAVGMAWIALIAEPGWRTREVLAAGSSPASASRWRSPRRRTRSSARSPRTPSARPPGANSMMRELGGVFGIAVVVAVFAGAGGYASAQAFTDGFAPRSASPPPSRRRGRPRAARPARRPPPDGPAKERSRHVMVRSGSSLSAAENEAWPRE